MFEKQHIATTNNILYFLLCFIPSLFCFKQAKTIKKCINCAVKHEANQSSNISLVFKTQSFFQSVIFATDVAHHAHRLEPSQAALQVTSH